VSALLLTAICLSIRPSVTLVIHAQTIQHIEMPFAPSDRVMHAFFVVAKLLVKLLLLLINL